MFCILALSGNSAEKITTCAGKGHDYITVVSNWGVSGFLDSPC